MVINVGDVKQIFNKYFECEYIWENPEAWQRIEKESPYLSVEYTFYNIEYQNLYFKEIYEELHNLSIVAYSGGQPMAIWPLCVYIQDGIQISAWGGAFLLPPFICRRGLNGETKRKFLKKCFDILVELCQLYNINYWISKELIMQDGVSVWAQLTLEKGGSCIRNNIECFLDLSLDDEVILKSIRRTNKYSILKGENMWAVAIISSKDKEETIDKVFDEFEDLHIHISKRRTRGHCTWLKQREAVKYTNDFVVVMRDDAGQLIGASLFCTSGTSCSYAVAAYRRELFDKPIAHVSQWYAIKHMKSLGLKWYYIGERAYSWNQSTDKEIAIGHFKEGFATDFFNTMFIKYNVPYIEK